MKNSKMKILTIIAVMCFGIGSANATTTALSFSYNAPNWDAVFGNNAVTGFFNDHYTFTVPVGAGGGGGGSVISGFAEFGPDVFITTFDLIDTTTASTIASGTAGPGIFKFFSFSGLNPADSYEINVKGGLLGSSGSGSYAGNFHISPIPEPETYAMLLAGLGLVGFMVRRRKEIV